MEFANMMNTAIELAVVMTALEYGELTVAEAEEELWRIHKDDELLPINNGMLRMVVEKLPLREWHVCETFQDGTTARLSKEFYCMDWAAYGYVDGNGKVIEVDAKTIRAISFMEVLREDMERIRKSRRG